MTTRGSYIHEPVVKYGGILIFFFFFLQFFQNSDGSDKIIHKAFRIHKAL